MGSNIESISASTPSVSEGHLETSLSLDNDLFFETLMLIEAQADEVEAEVQNSIEEVEGLKQFACIHCEKICKSKGGLTNHVRRMHAVCGQTLGDSGLPIIPNLTSEAVDNMLANIRRNLRESQLYDDEILAEVDKLQPSPAFYESIGKLFVSFGKNLSQDKLLQTFYGKIYSEWKAFFPSSGNCKYVSLALIHLPEMLVKLYKQETSVGEPKVRVSALIAF